MNLPTRTSTVWSSDDPAQVIKDFMRDYRSEHYKALAERADKMLRKALEKEEQLLAWTTTHRAKTRERLQEKLIRRHNKMNFQETVQITKDLWDLAGVRVILYFPSKEEHDKVQKVIQSLWSDVTKHEHPKPDRKPLLTVEHEQPTRSPGMASLGNSSMQQSTEGPRASEESTTIPKKYQPRHMGYRAVHYICKMDGRHEKDPYEFVEGDQVEIQVVSALTHAWATAGHDLLYKSYVFGESTSEEQRVFDALNGLIQSGDLILEQFQAMVHRRTYRRFVSHHELAGYLRTADVLRNLEDKPNFESEDIEIPLKVLRHVLHQVGRDCPFEVREALKRLGFPRYMRPDKSIAQFRTGLERVPEMELIVCLIADSLPKHKQPRDFDSSTPYGICHILMSAMKLLQTVFPLPEDANAYLQSLEMESDEKKSINFVLNGWERQTILQNQGVEEVNRNFLRHAWTWFQKQKQKPDSICGLVFQVAEMGALKETRWEHLLDRLTIGPLSRSSISEIGA
ncbi:hypothetical protein N0V90_001712 [Kalmusia sp. IMI 367209]|nr:hypothetical protein N0V90_001712 [Kalmusia sp. IMI 367209]